jgi:hypothetical protein
VKNGVGGGGGGEQRHPLSLLSNHTMGRLLTQLTHPVHHTRVSPALTRATSAMPPATRYSCSAPLSCPLTSSRLRPPPCQHFCSRSAAWRALSRWAVCGWGGGGGGGVVARADVDN